MQTKGTGTMDITSTLQLDGGIVERRFTVAGAGGRPVPGVLWTPLDSSGPTPLVLLGHGGSGSKDAPNMIAGRDYFTGQCRIATAAIDGPVHGDRGGVTSIEDPRVKEMWRTPNVLDDMVVDWGHTLDDLLALGEFDPRAVGYRGLSMGTMFGLPYVAAEPRIAVAVLGLCGVRPAAARVAADPDVLPRLAPVLTRLAADAALVTCPVFYHVQWDDELYDRNGAFELYGLIGSPDKRLQSTPGPHGGASREANAALLAFLADRLLRVAVQA